MRAGPLIGAAAALALAACPSEPPGCERPEDCAPGQLCLAGACVDPLRADAAVSGPDASLTRADAGAGARDAAVPGRDAGACAASENRCGDGADDDCDGATDCDDPDCLRRDCSAPCRVGATCAPGVGCSGGLARLCDAPPGECVAGAGVCDPATSACAYPARAAGSPCTDDGDPCTADECDGSGLCLHPAAPDGRPCGPGKLCRDGDCQPGCFIDGAWFAKDAVDPSNACRICRPAVDGARWTLAGDGAGCGVGRSCTGGVCVAPGACTIAAVAYPNGVPNPANPCRRCDAATDPAAWSPAVSGTGCPDDGNPCTTDACDGLGACVHRAVAEGTSCGPRSFCRASDASCRVGCLVDGKVFDSGAAAPADPCLACVSGTAWSFAPDGKRCGGPLGGDFCRAGSCVPSSCFVDGRVWRDGEASPSSGGCRRCDFAALPLGWTLAPVGAACEADERPCTRDACDALGDCLHAPLADGTVCGSGLECRGGACAPTIPCTIGGVTYPAGAQNPANPCEACQPGLNPGAWTGLPAGARCGAGAVCAGGSCQRGCFVDGALRKDGEPSPAGPCLACLPDASVSRWSPRPAQAACPSDANPCTADVCNGAGSCVHAAIAEGAPCGAGKVCAGGVCHAGCWLDGGFVATGGARPGQACLRCEPSRATWEWTALGDDVACGSRAVCCAGTCVSQLNPCSCGWCGNACYAGACDGVACYATTSPGACPPP